VGSNNIINTPSKHAIGTDDRSKAISVRSQKRVEESWKCPTRRPQQQYKEGDQVWLEGTNIRTYHLTAKLAPKRHGPFQITKVLGLVTYQLQLPDQWQNTPGVSCGPPYAI